MASQLVQTKKKEFKKRLMVYRTKVQARVQGCSFILFFCSFPQFIFTLLLKFFKNERHVMD
jgi:hypothetical protein